MMDSQGAIRQTNKEQTPSKAGPFHKGQDKKAPKHQEVMGRNVRKGKACKACWKGSSASRVVRPRKPREPRGVTIMDVKGTLRWCQTRLVNSRANPTRSRGKGKKEGYRSQRAYPSKTKTGRKADRV